MCAQHLVLPSDLFVELARRDTNLDRTKETLTQGRRGAERATYQNGMDETQTSLLMGFDLQPSESSQKHFLCASALESFVTLRLTRLPAQNGVESRMRATDAWDT